MDSPPDSHQAKFAESFGPAYLAQTTVVSNFDNVMIVITQDRLELCLHKHIDRVNLRAGWITPVGLFLSFLATLCASTFHDAFLFKGNVWQAIFVILAGATGIWGLISVIKAIWCWWIGGRPMDQLLNAIKKAAEVTAKGQ